MKQDLVTLSTHFPMFRIEVAKAGIKLCLDSLREGPEAIARLEMELSGCGDEEEEQAIIGDILFIENHMEVCREQIDEMVEFARPHMHHLN